MEKKQNEFKLSTMRQFGSEQISFTATVHSENDTLTGEEVAEQIAQIDEVITQAFKKVQEREIKEKALLAEASERRTEEVRKLDAALKEEMIEKKKAAATLVEAEKLSRKLQKNG